MRLSMKVSKNFDIIVQSLYFNHSFTGYVECVRILLENGSKPDSQDIDGNNALHRSAENGTNKLDLDALDLNAPTLK